MTAQSHWENPRFIKRLTVCVNVPLYKHSWFGLVFSYNRCQAGGRNNTETTRSTVIKGLRKQKCTSPPTNHKYHPALGYCFVQVYPRPTNTQTPQGKTTTRRSDISSLLFHLQPPAVTVSHSATKVALYPFRCKRAGTGMPVRVMLRTDIPYITTTSLQKVLSRIRAVISRLLGNY